MFDLTLIPVVLVGLAIAGGLNLAIIRIPHEGKSRGRPKCTRCGQPLAFWQLIPVVGWLAQGGRAACCQRPLHPIHLLVELVYPASLSLLYLRYGLTTPFFYLAAVAAVLVMTGAIDWLHRFIYTLFILLPALLAVIASPFVPGHSLINALIGLLIGGFAFALFYGLALILYPGKSAPFGLGDVYLAIFLGAALGFTNLMPALFYGMVMAGIASVLILIQRRRGKSTTEYLAYGSYLCVGALAYITVYGLGG